MRMLEVTYVEMCRIWTHIKKFNKASLFFKDKNKIERKLSRKTNAFHSLAFNPQTHTPEEIKEKGKKTLQKIYFK